jgi:hypothetical protein
MDPLIDKATVVGPVTMDPEMREKNYYSIIGLLLVPSRIARWYIFRPKIPILVYFEGPRNGKCWFIFGHLKYVTAL